MSLRLLESTITSVRRPARAAALGLLVFAIATAAPNVQFRDAENVGDTHLYQEYGEKVRNGKVPYADFYLEYPPAAIPVFVAATTGSSERYATHSKWLQWLLGAGAIVLAVAALARAGERSRRLYVAAVLAAVSPVLLGRVTFTRFDFWPALLTMAALVFAVGRQGRLAAAALAVGTAAKVYPVVLLPLLAARVARSAGRREAILLVGIYTALLLAIVAPFAAVGAGGLRFSLSVQLDRPLQIESLGGSLVLALGQLGLYEPTVVSSHGSQNLAGSFPAAIAIVSSLIALAALASVWILARPTRGAVADGELLTASAAAVAAFVAFGRVLSPQYLIWLIPIVPLARGNNGRAAAVLFLGALAATQGWSQGRYGDVVALEPIVWLVLARNLILAAVVALLIRQLAAGRRAYTTKPSTRRVT